MERKMKNEDKIPLAPKGRYMINPVQGEAAARGVKMKIFLIGYMYSGKTTVGKQLAKKLNYDFLDTDVVFETQYQTTISEFFAEHGEAEFRKAERKILEDLQTLSNNVVISTGGGLPCFNNNIELMRKIGVVIYLEASVGTIYKRFEKSNYPRPLLANLSKDDAIKKIENHLSEREQFYKQANITISAENVNFDVLLEILKFPTKRHSPHAASAETCPLPARS
jgi:shikimate kinase